MKINNPFIRYTIATAATTAVMSGLLFAGAPAASADTVSQPSLAQAATSGCNVRVWARATNVTGLRADATAVAFAGASAFAKIILEEVRTVDADKPAGKAPVPTQRQIDNAPVVHTMDEANALSAQLVNRYERKVRNTTKRIKVLKLTLKRSKTLTVEERQKLKKELRRAKKALNKLHANPPRMKGAHGMGFENTGYRDRKDLQPYADKVDGQYDVFQYVPELRDWIIIVKVHLNGTWVEACHNYVGFYIPPNTPDRDMFLIVRVITDVRATVTVYYTETISLTVGAEATDSNGKVVDYDEKTVTTTRSDTLTREGVPVTSMEEAIRIGEEMVRAAQQSRVGATATVSDTLVNSIGAELNVTCPGQPEQPSSAITLDGLNDIDETDPECLEDYTDPRAARIACSSWTVFEAHLNAGTPGTISVASKYGTTAFSRGTPANFDDDVKSLSMGSGVNDVEIRYDAPTEVPTGGFDTITVTFTPTGGGAVVTDSSDIRINETVAPPM